MHMLPNRDLSKGELLVDKSNEVTIVNTRDMGPYRRATAAATASAMISGALPRTLLMFARESAKIGRRMQGTGPTNGTLKKQRLCCLQHNGTMSRNHMSGALAYIN